MNKDMKVIWMMNSKIRGVHNSSVPDYGKSVCWKSRGIHVPLCTIFFSFFSWYGFFVTGQHDIILHSRQWLLDLPVAVPICTYTQPSMCNLACSKRSDCGHNTKRCEQKKPQGGGVWGLPENLEQAIVHVQLSLLTDHLPFATTHPKNKLFPVKALACWASVACEQPVSPHSFRIY